MSSKPHQRNLPVPFFSQREVRYEWQRLANNRDTNPQGRAGENITVANPARGIQAGFHYADHEIGYPIPLEGAICNIVSLAMLLHYYGITDDSPQEMLNKFFTTDSAGFIDRSNP